MIKWISIFIFFVVVQLTFFVVFPPMTDDPDGVSSRTPEIRPANHRQQLATHFCLGLPRTSALSLKVMNSFSIYLCGCCCDVINFSDQPTAGFKKRKIYSEIRNETKLNCETQIHRILSMN